MKQVSFQTKKPLSFLVALALAVTASAQQRQATIVSTDVVNRAAMNTAMPLTGIAPMGNGHNDSRINPRRTTTVNGRWYQYTDYLTYLEGTIGAAAPYMWNDTTSLDAYGSPTTYEHNNLSSAGIVCDPFVDGWNDPIAYAGMMQITASDAYTIDSVYVNGIYFRNNNNTTPVDTLTLTIFYGDGSTGSDLHFVARDTSNGGEWIYTQYGADTLYYMRMHFDSVNNRADTFAGGFTPVIKQIYLHSTDTSGNFQAVIPVNISVPAGNMPAMSVSFKTGDGSYFPGDTVFISDGTNYSYKHGMFRPYTNYVESAPNTPTFAPNSKYDQNQGEFTLLPESATYGLYYPHWFLIAAGTSPATASSTQYPNFAFHTTCSTCGILGVHNVAKNITAVQAYPVPAGNGLTVAFRLSASADVSISLTNIVGQQVAVQSLSNVSSGSISFNTSALPAGIYFYTLQTGGERYVNRAVIVH